MAIACRDDADWKSLAAVIGEPWALDPRNDTVAERLAVQDALDERIGGVDASRATGSRWPSRCAPPACPRRRWPARRIGSTTIPAPAEWGLWPTAHHREMGDVRVDGLPVHLSETDWVIERGGPCLGEHNHQRAVGDPRARRRRDRAAGEGRGDVSDATEAPGPLFGLRVVELAQRARRVRREDARRPRRRRDRGGTARRSSQPGLRAVRRRRGGPGAQPLVVALQHVEARGRARPRLGRRRRALPPARRRGRHRPRGRAARCPRHPAPRPPRSARRPRGAHLGVGHAVRSHRHAGTGARHRPHAAGRRRAGVELWVRRPLAAAGARRRQPGVPHRQHVRGARARSPRCWRATSPGAASTST